VAIGQVAGEFKSGEFDAEDSDPGQAPDQEREDVNSSPPYVHRMIRLLMGTGKIGEKTTAKTWIPRAIAAKRHADAFRCSKAAREG